MPNHKDVIQADLYRYDGATSLIKGLVFPGFRYTWVLRHVQAVPRRSLRGIVARLVLRRISYRFGFQIPARVKIGEGLYLGHFGTIVINPGVTIGKNCNIAPGVTIGATNRGERAGVPVIGDRVWIGTGVVIVGNVSVGSNVLIAPNSFVTRDVPANSLVAGNPATVSARVDATDGYINHVLRV